MSVITPRSDTTTSTAAITEERAPRIVSSRRHARVLTAVLGGLALATAGLVVLIVRPDSSPTTTPPDLSAYARGGSVYSQQVPTDTAPWTSAYDTSSSVYAEQVPTAAVPWTTAYAVGGSTYREQVPSIASQSWTSAYGSGSSTYREQVPSADRR